jgi:hypothetical protein
MPSNRRDQSWIDASLYPDTDPPETIEDLGTRVDFIVRLCAAWDFGLLPDPETVDEIRQPEWRAAVDAAALLTSPVYHLLRRWHDLPLLPYLGQTVASIRDDPCLGQL